MKLVWREFRKILTYPFWGNFFPFQIHFETKFSLFTPILRQSFLLPHPLWDRVFAFYIPKIVHGWFEMVSPPQQQKKKNKIEQSSDGFAADKNLALAPSPSPICKGKGRDGAKPSFPRISSLENRPHTVFPLSVERDKWLLLPPILYTKRPRKKRTQRRDSWNSLEIIRLHHIHRANEKKFLEIIITLVLYTVGIQTTPRPLPVHKQTLEKGFFS